MRALRVLRELFSRGANVYMFARAAPFYARYTVRFHLPAEVLIGLFAGFFSLADLVTRKTLDAPDWMLALQTSVPMMALLSAMVWRDLLEGRSRRRILLLTGIFGKGALVLVAFVASPGPLFAIVVASVFVDSAFIPLRNAIFRANYDERVRGRLFGGVQSVMTLAFVGANLLAAFVLDRWEWSYRILFPLAGIVGFGAHAIYARVRVRGGDDRRTPDVPVRPLRSLGRAFRTTVRILRGDPLFRAYELNFFIYGLAFLMNLPLVVILMVNELELDYDEASLGRFVVAQVAMIVLAPVAGRLLDKSHPARMMALSCALLTLHAGLLVVTRGFWTLFASYLVFGMAMAPVSLAWNLGPVQFARSQRDSADYMAVHVTLTGLRAVLAPGIALAAKQLLGLRAGFAVSTALYAISAILMFGLSRRIRRQSLLELPGTAVGSEKETP